jgi:acyl carrier protein
MEVEKSQLTRDELTSIVREAFAYAVNKRAAEAATVPLDAPIDSLGIQSVEALEMAGFVEDRLGIHFSDDDMLRVGTLNDLVSLALKYSR